MKTNEHDARIRRVEMNDAPEITELAHQLGYPTSVESMLRRLQVILNNPGQIIFTVDIPEKKTAGYIHAMRHVSLEHDPCVEVGGLVINQVYRKKGLGKLLLSAAEKWAKDIGWRQIRLHSNVIREESHRFYEVMGYTITKSQYQFVKTLDRE